MVISMGKLPARVSLRLATPSTLTFLIGKNGRNVAQQTAAVVGGDAHHQRVAGREATPDGFNDAFRRMRLQLSKLVTV